MTPAALKLRVAQREIQSVEETVLDPSVRGTEQPGSIPDIDPVETPKGPEGAKKNLAAAGKAVGAGRGETAQWSSVAAYDKLLGGEPLDLTSATWLLTALRDRDRNNDAHPLKLSMSEITKAVSAERPLPTDLVHQILIALPALSNHVVSAIDLEPAPVPENVGGVASEHLAKLEAFSRETGMTLAIARSNPDALRWHVLGSTTKPMSLKPKSQRYGEFAGLVTNPRHPEIQAQWKEAQRKAKSNGDRGELRAIRNAYAVALETWDAYGDKLPQSGYHVDDRGRVYRMRLEDDGVVRPTFLHADYDLVGVWAPGDGDKPLVDASEPAARGVLLSPLNRLTGRRAYFRHGAVFDPSYSGREMRGDAVLITPHGTQEVLSVEDMRAVAEKLQLELPE